MNKEDKIEKRTEKRIERKTERQTKIEPRIKEDEPLKSDKTTQEEQALANKEPRIRQLNHAEHQANQGRFPVCVVAQDMSMHNNIGSLFRLADALGIEQLYFVGDFVDMPNAKVSKIARHTDRHVAYSMNPDAIAQLKSLKSQGYRLIALEICNSSRPLQELKIDNQQPSCLILGAEQKGLSQALLELADEVFHIPMMGVNSSMNVVTASAIALYQITQQYQLVEKPNEQPACKVGKPEP